MRNGFRIGQLAGIHVYLDWSLLIIIFLISTSLAVGLFPAWHPDWDPMLSWTTAIAAAVLFFASVLAHELSHALVGRATGIRVERITLFVFGGMAHMENEPRAWQSELWMAAVGPLTSVVLGIIFLALSGLITGPVALDLEDPSQALSALGPAATLLFWLGRINIILALFNLVPGFPLDGGRVLRAILWGITRDLRKATRWASLLGQAFAWVLILNGFAMMLGMRVPFFGAGPIAGIWLAFIGWFLNNAAMVSYRQLLVRESLEHVPVARIMQTQYLSVAPDLDLASLVDQHLMRSGQRSFPVEQEGRFLGMVCLHDIRKVEVGLRATTTVSEIMTPAHGLTTVRPKDDAAEALSLLASRDVNQIPVTENDTLRGLVRREDILKWLTLHSGEGIERPRDLSRQV
jgi:Zn-dependent protease/predicted transcriptional regulator